VDDQATIDVGAYCRQVEDYLTRGNAGHLVRIVGPGFEIVRGWAEEGIPLSVVFRGIDMKLERHRAGQATRPLRVEFCEADVRDVYDRWRRAVGLGAVARPGAKDKTASDGVEDERKRPSLSKQLDRAVERLSRAAGRLDVPEAVRESIGGLLTELTALRDAAKRARGDAREAIAAKLGPLDAELRDVARRSAPADLLTALEREARQDLAAFRDRLPADRWQQAIDATVDRLLRDRWGLPTL
jgi:hypothetical protein